MTMRYKKELDIAINAARDATILCRTVQKDFLNSRTKKNGTASKRDTSPVTIADFGSQAIINMYLTRNFLSDKIVGEENASLLRKNKELGSEVTERVNYVMNKVSGKEIFDAIDRGNSNGGKNERFWAIDPIDGTKGFLRGEQYAIAIGLIENGQVVLGLLACPNLKPPNFISSNFRSSEDISGCMAFAIKGSGAFLLPLSATSDNAEQPVRLHVSPIEKPIDAWFVESVESAHSSHSTASLIAEKLGITKPPVRLDSQAKYAVVAMGDAPIYLRIPSKQGYIENIWDHAAGSIIVEEAGGIVTDIYGKELDFGLGRKLFSNRGILASNGKLHEAVLESINMVLND